MIAEPLTCPHCQCCTARLCGRALVEHVSCGDVRHTEADFDLSACPCSDTRRARIVLTPGGHFR